MGVMVSVMVKVETAEVQPDLVENQMSPAHRQGAAAHSGTATLLETCANHACVQRHR